MTLTLLFSQPVSALQILAKDGQWKWVKHVENGVVSNLSLLTGIGTNAEAARQHRRGR